MEKQRWEEPEKRSDEERKSEKRKRVRRKKMQVREEGKSRNTAFFQWLVAPEGWQVGSLKRRVRNHLARWEMKNCTPLQREAHFQVKMYKKNSCFGALLGIELSKKCTPLSIVARAGGERDRETQSLSHRSVHQLARSAIHASQQLTSPM